VENFKGSETARICHYFCGERGRNGISTCLCIYTQQEKMWKKVQANVAIT